MGLTHDRNIRVFTVIDMLSCSSAAEAKTWFTCSARPARLQAYPTAPPAGRMELSSSGRISMWEIVPGLEVTRAVLVGRRTGLEMPTLPDPGPPPVP